MTTLLGRQSIFTKYKKRNLQVVVAYALNSRTRKTEGGRSLWIWGQPGLKSEFQPAKDTQRNPVSKNKTRKEGRKGGRKGKGKKGRKEQERKKEKKRKERKVLIQHNPECNNIQGFWNNQTSWHRPDSGVLIWEDHRFEVCLEYVDICHKETKKEEGARVREKSQSN